MAEPSKPDYAYVNGEPYRAGETFDITSPIDERLLTTLPTMNEGAVDDAVLGAKQVFDSGVWRHMPKGQKQAILLKFADLIDAHAETLAQLQTLDMGMPLAMCQNKDIAACANTMRWYAHAIDKVYGETMTDDGKVTLITREPVGVVGCITPWNFPCMIVAWKIAPALILGNSVVLKPAESASMAVVKLAELAVQAGLPPGVFNVITGYGHSTGKALALHDEVRVMAFTGSGAVGAKLLQYAGQSNLKRVYLELGGKNANIIFPDVPNLDKAVKNSVMAIFANSGQICASPSRLLVHRDIHDVFVEKAIAIAKTLRVGNPLRECTTLGPVANKAQYDSILSHIARGREQGATCVLGGDTPDIPSGYYINPTIFTGVTPDMDIARQEIFGPVLSILSFDSTEQAVAMANDTEYGLTAGVWTANISIAHTVAQHLETGTVFVNHFGGGGIDTPFGGVKQSGNGVDRSLHALDKYCHIKSTIIQV